ncbi:MAG: TonB-dependent receptor, partial [Gemmatimonadaceae bacterium]|nr:TonB-dependent receptor [Gemmatimonadaceae bacterium]
VERTIGTARVASDASLASRNFGAADFYAPAPSYERTRTQAVSLRVADLPLGAWHIASSLSGRRHTDDFILRRADPGFYRNRHTTLQRTAEIVAARTVGEAVRMAAGVDGFDAELESARLGNRREQRAGAFTEATVGQAGRPSVTAGIRVDASTSAGTFASPSLSLALPAGRVTLLRASAGRGLRAPSWTERHYVDPAHIATADLEVERFWAGELGARAVARWGSLDAAAFVRRADALIDWIRPAGAPATAPWRTANLESATYHGVELSVGIPEVLGTDWTASVSGLRFDAEAADGYAGKYALRPLTRVVAASASRGFGERLRLSVAARAARRAGEAPYVHANTRAALRLRRGSLHLDATNLTGASYLDASAKPVAGPALTLGLQL